MTSMEFLTLLGEVNASDLRKSPPVPLRRRRLRSWIAAACLCLFTAVFAVWFFTPPQIDGTENGGVFYTFVRIDHQLYSYHILHPSFLSPYEYLTLPDRRGAVVGRHGDSTFYRAAERDDLAYLLMVDGDGKQWVLEFAESPYWPGMDLRDTQWYASGWLTDEDIAALSDAPTPTLGNVLETVYDVTSGAGIRRIRFEKDDAYNGTISKRVRVKPVTVRDEAALARFYGLLAEMKPAEYGQKLPFGSVNHHDESYLKGEAPLSAQVDRDITVTLESGYQIHFTFYPATGLLTQSGSNLYAVLSETDTQWLIRLADIDMDWKDWGTEEPISCEEGDGNETATRPASPDSP